MISASLRENYSMLTASEKLIDLYSKGIIPKAAQDFELALSGYGTGRTEAIVVVTRVRNLIDQENLYWGQLMEREKGDRAHCFHNGRERPCGSGERKRSRKRGLGRAMKRNKKVLIF